MQLALQCKRRWLCQLCSPRAWLTPTNRLPGLMSRCRMGGERLCRYCTPLAMERMMSSSLAVSQRLAAVWCSITSIVPRGKNSCSSAAHLMTTQTCWLLRKADRFSPDEWQLRQHLSDPLRLMFKQALQVQS